MNAQKIPSNLHTADQVRCSNFDLVCIRPSHTDAACNDGLFDDLYIRDPEKEIAREIEILERQIDDFASDHDELHFGKGPTVHMGLDSEFVSNQDSEMHTYLSLQFYVIGEGGTHTQIVYPKGPKHCDRPSFYQTIVGVIQEAMDKQIIREWPGKVVLCGFFLRTDLAAFGDMATFKQQLDSAGGKITTVGKPVTFQPESEEAEILLRPKMVIVKDPDGITRALTVRFVDIGSHVAVGTKLAEMGDQLNLPKLAIPEGYSIERMDLLLEGDKTAFEEYGLRDAEIAVRYFLKLQDFADQYAGVKVLPATASGLALKIFENILKDRAQDFNCIFGVRECKSTVWSTAKNGVITAKKKSLTEMRSILEPFVTDCYNGGRNECYAFGPTDVAVWNDFDLAGAYTTGLVDLRFIDYDNFSYSKNPSNFVGHVLGFALVEFEFPPETNFPCLPVRGSNGGLFFPLKGLSYCTAPEIEVALNLNCRLIIKHGIIVPWKDSDERIFEPFVTGIRGLRKQFVKGSPDELYAKLLGNSLYGKTAQGLKKKTVFDTHGLRSVDLPHSRITNAVMAAHTTGFIRAVLGEQIAGVPAGRSVISATTDGFITDAELSELDFSGPMATRFQALCNRVAPGTNMLEIKHKVRQLIAVKTRGQITAMKYEDDPIILAKAGVSPGVPVEEHNEFMLKLFLNRQAGDKTFTRPFTPIREQWMKGTDVIRLRRESTLNLEFDFKRQLVNPRVMHVADTTHIGLKSTPWRTIGEAERFRAIYAGWKRQHCLREMDDWQDWTDHALFCVVRDQIRSADKRGTVRATGKGIVDIFRRMFLRAYTQELCGLSKTMNYAEVANWLTKNGHPTTVNELKNAKRARFTANVIPVTDRVELFANVIKERFPGIDFAMFYAINSIDAISTLQ